MPDTTPPSGGGNPPNNPTGALNADLVTIMGTVDVMQDGVKKILDLLKESAGPTARLAEDLDKLRLNMRSIVDYAGDWKETLTELIGISKKLATGGIYDAKTYGGALNRLKELVSTQEKLKQRTGWTADQQKILTKLIDGTSKSMAELERRAKAAGKGMESALDSDSILAANKELRQSISLVEKLAAGFKKVDMGPITSATKTLNDLMGKKSRVQKWVDHAERIKGVREGVTDRVQTKASMFHTQYSNQRAYSPAGVTVKGRKVQLNRPVGVSAMASTQAAYKAMTPGERLRARLAGGAAMNHLDEDVDEVAGRSGGVFNPTKAIDRLMAKRILKNRNLAALGEQALPSGIMGERGLGALAKGGGSFTKGLSSMAEEGLAGGADALGGLAVGLAPVMAVGEGIKDVFDATAKRNKDIYGKIGNAGIFSNIGQTGQQDFQNVRSNLTPTGRAKLFSASGNTYESNLKIAQAMAASGVSLSELSQDGNGIDHNVVGRVGNTVRVGARLAGMDETQGTEQVMKLLQQYHQSLESTDQFFNKMNKDTKAAGITSTKYIQIIDSITNSFDHMARGIDDVTSLLRVLGSTGTMTSEQLEDTMKAMIGPEKSPEQKAFIGASMMNNPEYMSNFVAGRTAEAANGAKNAKKALGDTGLYTGTELDKLDLSSGKGVMSALDDLNTRANLNPDKKGALTSTAGGVLDDLEKRYTRLQAIQNFAANPTGEGAVEFAGSSELTADTPYGKMMQNIGGIFTALKLSKGPNGEAINPSELFADPSEALNSDPTNARSLLLTKVADTLGVSKTGFGDIVSGVHNAASGLASQAKSGSDQISKSHYVQMAEAMGQKGLNAEQAKTFLSKLDGDGLKKLTKVLTNEHMLMSMGPDSDVSKALEQVSDAVTQGANNRKAEEVAVSQRPTAEVFKDAFTNLFNSISIPLVKIMNWLEGWKSTAATPKELAKVKALAEGGDANGKSASIEQDMAKLEALRDNLFTLAKSKQTDADNAIDPDKQKVLKQEAVKATNAASNLDNLLSGGRSYFDKLRQGAISEGNDANGAAAAFTSIHQSGAAMDSQFGYSGFGMDKQGNIVFKGPMAKLAGNPLTGPNASAVGTDSGASGTSKGDTNNYNQTTHITQLGSAQLTVNAHPASTQTSTTELAHKPPSNAGTTPPLATPILHPRF